MAHSHFMGGSGTGKTTLLKHHVKQRLDNDEGFLFFDLHGEDIYDVIDIIPKHRLKQSLLYDPTEFPLANNMLADIEREDIPPVAAAVADIIKTFAGYEEIPTPRIINNVYFTTTALMDHGGTLADVPKMLLDDDYRAEVLGSLKDSWHREVYWKHFNNRPGKERLEYVDSSTNQFYLLCGDPRIRQSVAQETSSFSVADLLENNGIFLARIPQGRLGLNLARMVATFILAQFHLAALRRDNRKPFYIYLDEGHHFPESIVREILSGARKFGINLVFAHQYAGQVSETLLSALAGNCEEQCVFRVSKDDALNFERDRTRYDHLRNLYELPRYAYRKFTFVNDPVDVTVLPFDPARFPDNRRYIEESMRRNYVRPLEEGPFSD